MNHDEPPQGRRTATKHNEQRLTTMNNNQQEPLLLLPLLLPLLPLSPLLLSLLLPPIATQYFHYCYCYPLLSPLLLPATISTTTTTSTSTVRLPQVQLQIQLPGQLQLHTSNNSKTTANSERNNVSQWKWHLQSKLWLNCWCHRLFFMPTSCERHFCSNLSTQSDETFRIWKLNTHSDSLPAAVKALRDHCSALHVQTINAR